MKQLSRILAGSAVLFCSACALIQSPAERADDLASTAGFHSFTQPELPLQAYVRIPLKDAATRQRLTLYIEGDGAPWPTAGQAPRDPTPIKPLVMRMAIADPSPLVAYVGRPCQYQNPEDLQRCDTDLWTHGRYSEQAVHMLNRMVEALKQSTGAREIALVGYSGGGAMAALLAARRNDTICLVTVAAPLDTRNWTSTVGVSSLRTSLNPADQTGALKKIRQTHFSGLRDTVVPRSTISTYLSLVPKSQLIERSEFGHDCCWAEEWIELRQESCLADR